MQRQRQTGTPVVSTPPDIVDPPRRGRRYLIAMVGLPARGKTFTARKLRGYLTWLGYPARSFNVGEHRRRRLGPGQPANFFDPDNRESSAWREQLLDEMLEAALEWLGTRGRIAILDATNSTRLRRARIREFCDRNDIAVLFVELRGDEPGTSDAGAIESKLTLPDYAGTDRDAAIADFMARLRHYEHAYQPLGDDEGSWIRVEGRGRQVVLNRARGWLVGRMASLLTTMAVSERPIWFVRHGESEFNRDGRIGGDSALTERGEAFAARLAAHVRDNREEFGSLDVWTSTLRRTMQTAAALPIDPGRWRSLNEIDAGICDGFTYDEIRERWPDEYAARERDKLRYRYPGGESYLDVIARVDRVILELESFATPVLVVSHRATIRALYAYFMQLPMEEAPHVDVPLHTLIKLVPKAHTCEETRVGI